MQSGVPPHHLVLELISLEAAIASSSLVISRLLSSLCTNAQRRIEAVVALERFRNDRTHVIQLETAIQNNNRDMLRDAAKEMEKQAQWSKEMRSLWDRARSEGIDTDDWGPPPKPSGLILAQPDSQQADGEDRDPFHSLSRESRLHLYRLQLTQLQAFLTRSEEHTSSLLSRLRFSQSLALTRAQLNRLQSQANSTTVSLAELSLERNLCSVELKELEEKRRGLEAMREERVLDLVVGWKERQRFQQVDEAMHRLCVV